MEQKLFAISNVLCGKDIKAIRKNLKLTQAEFAQLCNVSVKTIERWEGSDKEITGPIVTLMKILSEYPQLREELEIPARAYQIRKTYLILFIMFVL